MKKLVTALLLVTAYALAQAPSAVAIRNAKIVTVSGPVIAKGTVVVRNGLIEAVGENVQVPAAPGGGGSPGPARAGAATAAGGRGGRNAAKATPAAAAAAPAPRSNGPEDRPQATSWLLGAGEIQAPERRIETVRGSGITTVVAFPERGIFAGQGAVIDLISGEK